MLPRRLLPWLFVLTLLFGQAAAFAHVLSHLRTHDPSLPDKTCEVCVAQAQLGAAVPPGLIVLAIPSGDHIVAPGDALAYADLAPRSACARAPPALSEA